MAKFAKMRRIKSHVHAARVCQPSRQTACHDQQRERARHLRDHQHIPQGGGSRGQPRRSDPLSWSTAAMSAREAASAGQSPAPTPASSVAASEYANTRQSRLTSSAAGRFPIAIGYRADRIGGPGAQDDARRSAQQRQQEALSEYLPDQPGASRSQRGSHRHLTLANGGAHQQNIADVHTRHHEH